MRDLKILDIDWFVFHMCFVQMFFGTSLPSKLLGWLLRLGGAAPALAQQSLEETLNDVWLACCSLPFGMWMNHDESWWTIYIH